MCIDYYTLNTNPKSSVFPLPYIADLLDKLGKPKFTSSIDLATAYHWVRIAKGNMEKTTLLTKKGLY